MDPSRRLSSYLPPHLQNQVRSADHSYCEGSGSICPEDQQEYGQVAQQMLENSRSNGGAFTHNPYGLKESSPSQSTQSVSMFRRSQDPVFVPKTGDSSHLPPHMTAGDAFGEDEEDEECEEEGIDPHAWVTAGSAFPTPGMQASGEQSVHNAKVSSSTEADSSDGTKRNLFISGLSEDINDAKFRTMLELFGEVQSARVMLNIRTGVSRGFGFALFSRAKEAAAALASLHGQQCGENKLKVTFSEHRGQNLLVESNKLYVRNVPSNALVSDGELVSYFSKFGTLKKLQPRADRHSTVDNNREIDLVSASRDLVADRRLPLRVLFVEYSTCESARRCVDETHNSQPFPSCKTPLLAKIFEPQELRTQRLKEQNQARKAHGGEKQGPLHPPNGKINAKQRGQKGGAPRAGFQQQAQYQQPGFQQQPQQYAPMNGYYPQGNSYAPPPPPPPPPGARPGYWGQVPPTYSPPPQQFAGQPMAQSHAAYVQPQPQPQQQYMYMTQPPRPYYAPPGGMPAAPQGMPPQYR